MLVRRGRRGNVAKLASIGSWSHEVGQQTCGRDDLRASKFREKRKILGKTISPRTRRAGACAKTNSNANTAAGRQSSVPANRLAPRSRYQARDITIAIAKDKPNVQANASPSPIDLRVSGMRSERSCETGRCRVREVPRSPWRTRFK